LPGTTRDLIAAPLRLAAGSVWLLDAAGIGAAGHELDAAAQRTARQAAESADAVLLVLDARDPRRQNRYWLGADLVVEVVSPDNPERDTVTKRADYAEGRIPEYWIVSPEDETITVLTLAGDAYAEHGVFRRGAQATSALLEGFAVSVDAVFDAE
jgi:tRNA U34 5-carboxymethylaminomethyl modifying GTPase MnmE/TrmE